MALARIITHSQVCSRELALDLLARGYAVEIISPENVPDNTADLELRVDIGPGDQLIANVEAHDGERAASLEFVRHLKAPTVNFMHGPPEIADAGGLEEDACQILSPTPVEPAGCFAVEVAASHQPNMAQPTVVELTRVEQSRVRSTGWPWRAALTLVLVVLPAVVLVFSVRRTSKAAARTPEVLPAEKIAAPSTGMNPLRAVDAEQDPARDPGQVSAAPLPTAAADSEGNFRHAPTEVQVGKVGAPAASPRTAVSRDDLIARDTVTYLDKRFEPTPKAKPAKPRPAHGGGVIAANTVTYLNKPVPKTAK
jgi:hypothetical protein